MTVKLYDRGGMNTTTIGTGTTLALGSALGAVAPFVCSFIDFGTAGTQNGDTIRVLILDNNGNWEISTGTYSTTGPQITGRTVESSSNSNSPISLTGSAQVFIMAGALDIVTNFNGRSPTAGAITPASGDYTISGNTVALPQSYLAGMQLSNDGTTPNTVLDISAGQCRDNANATNIVLAAFTKSTGGAWTAGSAQNGMGNGLTIANSTWYHVFAIINNGAADVYFDTDVGAANKPASTSAFRRIGSFKTDGSAHIIAFTQSGDEFLWTTTVADVNAANPGTSAVTRTLTVPTGVKVWPIAVYSVANSDNSGLNFYFSSLDQTDEAPVTNSQVQNVAQVSGVANHGTATDSIRTNTSAQVRTRISFSSALVTLTIQTRGWIDRRGRDT